MLKTLASARGRVGELLNAVKQVVGTDSNIFLPFAVVAGLASIRYLLFLWAAMEAMILDDIAGAILRSLFILFMFFPFELMVQAVVQSVVSSVSRDALLDGKSNWSRAWATVRTRKWALFSVALLTMIIKRAQSNKREGFWGFLINLAVSLIGEAWDLMSNFGIAAMSVENAKLSEIAERLKELRTRIPETLVGVVGIDFAGGVAASILGGGLAFSLLLGGALGYVFVDGLPSAYFVDLGEVQINTLPLIVLIGLSCIVNAPSSLLPRASISRRSTSRSSSRIPFRPSQRPVLTPPCSRVRQSPFDFGVACPTACGLRQTRKPHKTDGEDL